MPGASATNDPHAQRRRCSCVSESAGGVMCVARLERPNATGDGATMSVRCGRSRSWDSHARVPTARSAVFRSLHHPVCRLPEEPWRSTLCRGREPVLRSRTPAQRAAGPRQHVATRQFIGSRVCRPRSRLFALPQGRNAQERRLNWARPPAWTTHHRACGADDIKYLLTVTWTTRRRITSILSVYSHTHSRKAHTSSDCLHPTVFLRPPHKICGTPKQIRPLACDLAVFRRSLNARCKQFLGRE